MLRETVTVSFGEVNSAVNAASEYGDFDRELVPNNACSDVLCWQHATHILVTKFCLITIDTWVYRASADGRY